MGNLLGIYWSVMHRRPEDYDYFKGLNPSVMKLMDGGQPDYQWVRQYVPGALVVARDWALSEQKEDMLRDPVGTGIRHAQEWFAKVGALGFDPANTLVLGINEPSVWEVGVSEALRQYTIAMCDEAKGLGLRVGAMQLSVGWPANTGADTPPDWSPWHGVEDAIKRGNHMLVLHEYWADSGPQENWGWWGGRALKCPWNVPILIGECGVDMYVKDGGVAHETRGWVGRMHPSRYAAELNEYAQRMAADSRFVGCCVFASDYANREWASFDVQPAYGAILALPPVASAEAQPPVYLPVVGGGVSQEPTPIPQGIVDPQVLEAILQIESGGRAIGDTGKPIIRFEVHVFEGEVGDRPEFRHGVPAWTGQQMFVDGAWKDIHVGSQASEWQAYELAKSINPEAAARSISVGAAQIMGFNAKRIGYPTAQAMLQAFANPNVQVIGFVNFLLSDPILWKAVKDMNWREIAKRYNGAGAVDTYAPLLQGAYEKIKERT